MSTFSFCSTLKRYFIAVWVSPVVHSSSPVQWIETPTNHREITVAIKAVLLLQSTMQQEHMLQGWSELTTTQEMIWRLLSYMYNSWAIILMTTVISCTGCIHIYIAHSNLFPEHTLQQPVVPKNKQQQDNESHRSKLGSIPLKYHQCLCHYKFASYGLAQYVHPPFNIPRSPLTWYHFPLLLSSLLTLSDPRSHLYWR